MSYGYGNNYYNHFEQRVGKSSRDSWTKAIERNLNVFLGVHYDLIRNLPNIVEK